MLQLVVGRRQTGIGELPYGRWGCVGMCGFPGAVKVKLDDYSGAVASERKVEF